MRDDLKSIEFYYRKPSLLAHVMYRSPFINDSYHQEEKPFRCSVEIPVQHINSKSSDHLQQPIYAHQRLLHLWGTQIWM
ncbi:hypothetical protein GJ496_003849 [Pomphorhynchus laevis]|nr:hypothetical protein GJ496_003849 [Pomphorhynchus laevis]